MTENTCSRYLRTISLFDKSFEDIDELEEVEKILKSSVEMLKNSENLTFEDRFSLWAVSSERFLKIASRLRVLSFRKKSLYGKISPRLSSRKLNQAANLLSDLAKCGIREELRRLKILREISYELGVPLLLHEKYPN